MSLCCELSQVVLVNHVSKFVDVNVQTRWTVAQYHTMTLTEKNGSFFSFNVALHSSYCMDGFMGISNKVNQINLGRCKVLK